MTVLDDVGQVAMWDDPHGVADMIAGFVKSQRAKSLPHRGEGLLEATVD